MSEIEQMKASLRDAYSVLQGNGDLGCPERIENLKERIAEIEGR